MSSGAVETRAVQGRVHGAGRGGLEGLFVEVVDCVVGGDSRVGQALTGDNGSFIVAVTDAARPVPDLQVRVWTSSEPDAGFVGESAVAYDVTDSLVLLDVELEAGSGGLESEYDALLRSVTPLVADRLGELRESDVRSDVTHVAAKSGWDARGVAFATLADRLTRDSADSIPAPLFYGLLRAGLPSEPDVLFHTSSRTVEALWTDAIERGVIGRDLADQVPEAVEAFEREAARRVLGSRATGVSSLDELLDVGFPGDEQTKNVVASLQVRADSPERFWDSVDASLDPDVVQRLRLDSRLASLTLNNAPLVAALHASAADDSGGPLVRADDLARRSFHQPARWAELLDDTVPEVIPGDTVEQKRENYADFLAAQVRLSFPTAVVADRVSTGELSVTDDDAVRDGIASFLSDNLGRFELGVEPVARFIAGNDDVSGPEDERVVAGIEHLQRLYQVTPDDTSLAMLVDQGLDSATAISAIPAAEFVRGRSADVAESTARLVHARATQISDLVTNLAATYLIARTAPGIGNEGGILRAYRDDDEATPDTLPLPTLEDLFGSLNNDACEHCGSVLSPAAYLVDLLHFLDRPRAQPRNPLKALLDRRPDIGHLPLTCDNTNTLVPHIDLVTETLEHFVRHGTLSSFTGHSTPDSQTSEEALAHPAFVDDDAYVLLKKAWYPAPLPFDRHLEDLRSLLERLGVPLADALRVLRRNDEVAPDQGYGWRDIAREQAGISRPLAQALTDRSVPLPDLLGHPASTTVDAVAADLGTTRGWVGRLALTYAEVDRLLATRLVNPKGVLAAVPPPPPPPVPGAAPPLLPPYDQFVVQHVDPDPGQQAIRPVEVRRTVRFVRLWRALGWSMEVTDMALVALIGANAVDRIAAADEDGLDKIFDSVLSRLGTVVTVLRRLELDVAEGLQPLLACWSDLETAGPDALYRRLFLTGSTQHADFAPDEAGAVLTDPPALADRAEVLRAAFGVTAEELAAAAADLGEAARLDLPTLSTLFRRTWLARTLGLGQGDFQRLLAVTGIDPFDPPDQPASGMVRLLDLLDSLAAIGVPPADGVAALWPRAESTGGRIDPLVLAIARDARRRRRAADAGLQVADEVSADRMGELLGIRFGSQGRHFATLVAGALAVEVDYAQAEPTLSSDVIEAGEARLVYDHVNERLSWSGQMSETTHTTLLEAGPSEELGKQVDALFVMSGERAAQDQAFARFGSDLDRALEEYPDFEAAWVGHLKSQTQDVAVLVEGLLRDVREQRRHDDTLAAVVAATGSSAELGSILLDTPGLLGGEDPAFDQVNAAVAADSVTGLRKASTSSQTTYSGSVDVAASGVYRFAVRVKSNGAVSITVDGKKHELPADGELRQMADPVVLTADRFVVVVVEVAGQDRAAALEWQRESGTWEPVPPDALYDDEHLASLREVLARYVAAMGIAEVFALGPAGLHHLAGLDALKVEDQAWLGALPVNAAREGEAGGDAETGPELGKVLGSLVGFARLSRQLRVDDKALVAVLEEPAATTGDRLLLAEALAWDEPALRVLLEHRGLQPLALGDVGELAQVSDAMALWSSSAAPMDDLLKAVVPDPGPEAVRVAENALRSRHGAGWLEVLKAVSDPIRIRRRDALVAFVLRELRETHPEVDTADKLFDFFLMDVQMQPPIATSRVRHAIAAVQLFVERILMNLGPVPPEVFEDPERWQSIKRYRLWEANRQVFLWPENWLEPQLRTTSPRRSEE